MLNIKAMRIDMDLSQLYVASEIGISDRAYRNIENGKSKPSIKTLEELERFFNKPYQELLQEV